MLLLKSRLYRQYKLIMFLNILVYALINMSLNTSIFSIDIGSVLAGAKGAFTVVLFKKI